MAVKKEEIEKIIRVDQAGEYGATRIYQGQIDVMKALGKHHMISDLEHMKEQEDDHLKRFNDLCIKHKVRPTFLQPLWHIGGYAMGAVTALMGEKAAHACTIAVEETIDEHYQEQQKQLSGDDNQQELYDTVTKCHEEELEHRDLAVEKGGREAPGYDAIYKTIRSISKAAIWLSKKI